jgi:hypothetical protein
MKILVFLAPFVAFGAGIYWLYKMTRPTLMKGTFVVMVDDIIIQVDSVEYDKVQRELILRYSNTSLTYRDFAELRRTFSIANPLIPNLEITCVDHVMVYPQPQLSLATRTHLVFKSNQELEFLPNLELIAY